MSGMSPEVQAALDEVAARCQVPVKDARLVHQHSNSAIALPTARLLVRIAGNPDALDAITSSVAVTRWLASRGYPCVEPADVDPFSVFGRVVSIWRLLDVAEEPPGNGAELGRLLRELHRQPNPPIPLQHLTDPFESVAAAVKQHPDGMTGEDRAWLRDRIEQLRHNWTELTPALPTGLIHGDAHTNNIIRLTTGKTVLGDWDHVALGPREWDLIQAHYMARRFNRHTEHDLRRFAVTYGWDVRDWPGAETLIQTREITGLSPYIRKAPSDHRTRQEVAHRIASLRNGDTSTRWNSPTQ
ncbi:phosphotransferase [Actinomadura sp. 7K534]|uniref:phosphotransferase n=1 Tax=Actinomadura sp. 7K534 TaxID=2530366 RepID=UPI00104322D8|nr:phosphotransferase [Actinomadura sp. 7K534]TDB91861.1 aminoglycoside phosphotransferase family protein [Actinomadura sp. 7K534]